MLYSHPPKPDKQPPKPAKKPPQPASGKGEPPQSCWYTCVVWRKYRAVLLAQCSSGSVHSTLAGVWHLQRRRRRARARGRRTSPRMRLPRLRRATTPGLTPQQQAVMEQYERLVQPLIDGPGFAAAARKSGLAAKVPSAEVFAEMLGGRASAAPATATAPAKPASAGAQKEAAGAPTGAGACPGRAQ